MKWLWWFNFLYASVVSFLVIRGMISIYWGVSPFFVFFATFFISAVMQPEKQIFLKSISKKPKADRTAYLTFDDGPDAEKTIQILETLSRCNVQATFFLIGNKVGKSKALVKEIKNRGHAIGNHSYAHTTLMPFWSKAKLKEDIRLCNSAIKNATGELPKLYRPPYGVTNPHIKHAVNSLNLQAVSWSFRTYDAARPLLPKMAQRMADKLKNGDIILMHDTTKGLPDFLNAFIPMCKDRGFNFPVIEPET